MQNKNIIIPFAFAMIVLAGCDNYTVGPTEKNTVPPGRVTDIQVENLPGQARLTYKLPTDPDLLYVKAVYPLNSGEIREIKASYYTNTMLLDGFGDTEIHEVEVYAVNRSEIASEPVVVEVRPEENPIWGVFRSLQIADDFSGVHIKAENPSRTSVVIEVMMKDSLGVWRDEDSIESSLADIEGSVRGLSADDEYEFRFAVRDRFLNYTDTLYATVNPMYEELLDKSYFKAYDLPGDITGEQSWLPMNLMWDNVYVHENQRWLTNANPNGSTVPNISTFDIGTPARLSRITVFNWGYDPGFFGNPGVVSGDRLHYVAEHIRRFEIWGTMTPDPDGSLDSWTLLGTFENEKPSGLPYGQQTLEDYNAAVAGFEYIFPIDGELPKVRYVRIRNLASWDGTTKFGIAEIDLYGDTRSE